MSEVNYGKVNKKVKDEAVTAGCGVGGVRKLVYLSLRLFSILDEEYPLSACPRSVRVHNNLRLGTAP